MILATGIEIAASGASSPALGKSPAESRGVARQANSIQSLSASIAGGIVRGTVSEGAESFRTGWQSLLASLVPNVDSSNEGGRSGAPENSPTGQAQAKAGGSPSNTVPASIAVMGMRTKPEMQEGIASAGLKEGLTSDVAERSAVGRTVQAGEPVSTKIETKKPAKASPAASANTQKSLRPVSADKPKIAAADPLPGMASAAIESPPQTVLAPVVDASMLQRSEGNAQMATSKDESSIKQGQGARLPSRSGASLSAVDAEALPNVEETLSSHSAAKSGGPEPSVALAATQEPIQDMAASGVPSPTLAGSRNTASEPVHQAEAPVPDVFHSVAASQDFAQSAFPSEKKVPAVTSVPVQSTVRQQTSSWESDSVQGQDPVAVPGPGGLPTMAPVSQSSEVVLSSRQSAAMAQRSALSQAQTAMPERIPAWESVLVQETPQAPLGVSDSTQADVRRKESTPMVSQAEPESSVRAHGSNSIEISAASQQAPTKPVSHSTEALRPVPAPNTAEPVAASQDSSPRSASGADREQTAQPDLLAARTAAPRPDSPRNVAAAGEGQQGSATDSSQPQLAATKPDPLQPVVTSQRETSASLPRLNPMQAAAPSMEALPATPGSVQTAGPKQIALQMPVESQRVTETIASLSVTSPVPAQSHEIHSKASAARAVSDSVTAVGSEASAQLPVPVSSKPAIPEPVSTSAGMAVPVAADKSHSAGGSKTSKQDIPRLVRASGGLKAVRHENPLVAVQPAAASVEASATAAGVAGLRGALSQASELEEGSTAAISAPGSRETFEALDSQSAMERPAWIHSGAQRAEVGFEDPSLGWVGVRAESDGGRVHAEVVPGSADAAQALSGHLAGLNAYLAEHHTQVETLTVATPESRPADMAGDRQMQQGAGQHAGQQTAQGAGSGSSPSPSSSSNVRVSADSGSTVTQGGAGGSAEIEGRKGMHISVMA